MITIAEVIEQCALRGGATAMGGAGWVEVAETIRALAAQYEGCIVAEGKPVLFAVPWQGQDHLSLYRAKEPTK